ncbi:S24 family peptidase [Pedobacter agri]|uniref:Peptidase S24/S26A/S26B/S26C domain-containing protein n=1 Tax=Pedobacter agri TaxID=454586 RepID=A0A9X3IAP8_9SPHI|nr:hypothetical protein [Pedobacter agri]MCX3266590.1 hypothetical protein [Pedobacter agri]
MTDNQEEKISEKFVKLDEIRRHYNFKNDSEFAKAIKTSKSYFSEIKSSGKIPKTMGQKLEDNLRVSRQWFENGEGEMLLPLEKSNGKLIGELNYPLDPGETPFIELGEGQYLMVMPLVNEYAYAGYLSGYADPEYVEELSKHTIIVTKQHRGTYRAFEVVGDSMDDGTKDSIPDGSIATGREIQRHLWQAKFHTHRFKDYIIVHKTDGILTKRITKHDVEKGIITCHSLNKDKDSYPDFKVDLNDVKQMFNIVNVSIAR